MNGKSITRRVAMQSAAGLALTGIASGSAPVDAVNRREPLRFDDPIWNREARARIEGDTAPGKFVYGSANGVVNGVRDGEKVRPLFRFEVFSTNRVLRQPDGSYQRLNRELVFYRDIETQKLLDEWHNSYSGETVRVVDVANDPFNYIISEFQPEAPSYGGLNKEKTVRRPFLGNWGMAGPDTVTLEADIHLYYPSALQPDKWPRESPGKMSRVSEMFRYFIPRAQLEDQSYTHVNYVGTWSRITPWLPWMLMDQSPGSITYFGTMMSRAKLEDYPADVIERVKQRYPRWLSAPDKWEEPSLSSLERYAREQKPAPPKAASP